MYTAIQNVSEYLKELNIPHKLKKMENGYQITFSFTDADVIEHDASYGSKNNLMEVMGFDWNVIGKGENSNYDSVLGYLTEKEVLKLIVCEYIEKCF